MEEAEPQDGLRPLGIGHGGMVSTGALCQPHDQVGDGGGATTQHGRCRVDCSVGSHKGDRALVSSGFTFYQVDSLSSVFSPAKMGLIIEPTPKACRVYLD